MQDIVHGIKVNYSRDSLFDELGMIRLKESYMREDETSPQERFAYVSSKFGSNIEHAQRLYEYSSNHWLSYATPILSFGRSKRGLPISCFTGDTEVMTLGGFKSLRDIKVGDEVLSHDGTYNAVEAIKEEMSYDIYELTINTETFQVTGNHLFLTKEDNWVRVDALDLDRHNIVNLNGVLDNGFTIKRLSKIMVVYDIQVANTNTFTAGKNLNVVHNCFLNYIEDTAEGLVDNLSETNWLSMMGGGVGIGFGIRSADATSTGVMPHLKIYDASSLAYRQGKTRRGSYAAYLNIDHPDIIQFIEMRKATGDQNMKAMNLHHGVNIPDSFMEIIERCMLDADADDSWALIDPHSHEVRETVSAKALWQQILELRMQTGEPYLHFIDESNRRLPQHLKDLGLKIHQSNLCSEIILPTNEQRTAVCCLSSLNLEYYDAWKKDPVFLRDIAEMLDNVLQYFIDNAPDTIARARFSASRERSIGIGALGFHALLQKKNLPWESALATSLNKTIFKHVRKELDKANLELGKERGEAPDAIGTGMRFSHTSAIAPNASSSILMGNTSPSIEPFRANAYRQDTLSGSHLHKNQFLDKVVKAKASEYNDGWYGETWSSIIANDGSVQHLTWMDDWNKNVFKTAMEIDQRWVIQHAADRQEYIDQAQSLNVFFRPDSHIKYIHAVHFMAWQSKLKTMYYCRSDKIAKADKVSKRIERDIIKEIDLRALTDGDECLACSG